MGLEGTEGHRQAHGGSLEYLGGGVSKNVSNGVRTLWCALQVKSDGYLEAGKIAFSIKMKNKR